MELSNNNDEKKFKKVTTSENDALLLREVLGMLAMEDSIITWGKRIVQQWIMIDNEFHDQFAAYKIILDGTNRRWTISNVELVDDKVHIVISMFQAGFTKVIVWNVPGKYACHKTCISNGRDDVIIPVTSSLLILHRNKECDVFYLKKYNREYISYDTVDFKNFDIIRVLKDCRNHIVTLNKLENVISIWKISREECRRVSSYRSKHLANCVNMNCISKSVLILTCLDRKLLLKLSSNNHIYSENLVQNLHFSEILTNFSNSVVLRVNLEFSETYDLLNLDTGISEEIVTGPYDTEQNKCHCIYLKSSHTILILTYDSFNLFKYKLPESMVIDIQYGEIRKNARLLSQAIRTGSSPFQYLPIEICIKIISMTSEHIFGARARRISEQFFCRPSSSI